MISLDIVVSQVFTQWRHLWELKRQNLSSLWLESFHDHAWDQHRDVIGFQPRWDCHCNGLQKRCDDSCDIYRSDSRSPLSNSLVLWQGSECRVRSIKLPKPMRTCFRVSSFTFHFEWHIYTPTTRHLEWRTIKYEWYIIFEWDIMNDTYIYYLYTHTNNSTLKQIRIIYS